MGKAIVGTPAAVHGLEIEPGVEALIVPSVEAMADAVLGLFENREARTALERSARRKAEACYGWDAIARRQAALYSSLINCPPRGAPS